MADRPYVMIMEANQLAANARKTLIFNVGSSEQIEVYSFQQQSTGTFSIEDIYDSDGNQYTNASPSTPIPSAFIPDVSDENNGLITLVQPIIIPPNHNFKVDIIDTSGSQNTITLVFNVFIRRV